MADSQYAEGQKVRVYDVGRKRWYKGKTLWLVRYATEDTTEAWEVQLSNGNRGMWSSEYMQKACQD